MFMCYALVASCWMITLWLIFVSSTEARSLSRNDAGYFGKAFKFMDADRTGFIDKDEFKLAIKFMNLDQNIRSPVVDALLTLIDSDDDRGDGVGTDIQCAHRCSQKPHTRPAEDSHPARSSSCKFSRLCMCRRCRYREFAKYMSSETLNDVTNAEKIEQAMSRANANHRVEIDRYNAELLGTVTPQAIPPQGQGVVMLKTSQDQTMKNPTPRQRINQRVRSATPRARGRNGKAKAGSSDDWQALKRNAEAVMKPGMHAQGTGAVLTARPVSFNDLGLADSERLAEILPEGVSAKQLQRALKQIQMKFKDKFQRMSSAFKNMDKDRSGTLDRKEILFVLKEDFNLNLSDNEIDAVINLMDVDKSGSIEYTEFARVITAGNIETTWQEKLAHSSKDLTDATGLKSARG